MSLKRTAAWTRGFLILIIATLACLCVIYVFARQYTNDVFVGFPARLAPAADGGSAGRRLRRASIPRVVLVDGLTPDLSAGGVYSLAGTTGPGVVRVFAELLQNASGRRVDLRVDGEFPARAAADALEKACVWDPVRSAFANPGCPILRVLFSPTTPRISAHPSEVDIVIPSIRNLHFLDEWKQFLYGFHIIIVQDGDPAVRLLVPAWVDYELYNRADIDRALGNDSWVVSHRDASVRNFGFLVSRKRYIYTLDDDTFPVALGGVVRLNPLVGHMRNLKTNATPFFFNTLYDPFRAGSDFVRGYPYSLRDGVPSVVSHGLWLHVPDYDAATQLLKPQERNTVLVDAVQTVPAGTLYPMCSMNVAFDRARIGPAFMQGFMGDGQPWARYDDMFAGWASKVCADHLRLGVKSGTPYIEHRKASNPFTNLKKEFAGMYWQEPLVRFLHALEVPAGAANASECYGFLAQAISREFAPLHPYFARLGRAMQTWVRLWAAAQDGALGFRPSRRAAGSARRASASIEDFVKHHVDAPGRRHSKPLAVFTIVRNEAHFLPLMLQHYAAHVDPEDIYVLDNDSSDNSTDVAHHVVAVRNTVYFDHSWLVARVRQFGAALLAQGYRRILFVEADELIAPNPRKYPGGLLDYVAKLGADRAVVRATGYNVRHDPALEPSELDFNVPVLKQRTTWCRVGLYDKPLLTTKVLDWAVGFHSAAGVGVAPDPDLVMFHLHFFDYNFNMKRTLWKLHQKFHIGDASGGKGLASNYLKGGVVEVDMPKIASQFREACPNPQPIPREYLEPPLF